MKKEHLDFLEYILPILNNKYPIVESIQYLENGYNKKNKIESKELHHLYEIYDSKYFQITNDKTFYKITTHGKDIIDNYGSLSKYLEFEKEKLKKQNEKISEIESLNKRISVLTITNLELQNRQLRLKILYSIIGFIFAALATNWKDILIMLQIIDKQ